MSTDLEIIKELQAQTGVDLKKVEFKDINKKENGLYISGLRAFSIDSEDNVIGLSLDYTTMESAQIELIFKLANLQTLSLKSCDFKDFTLLKKLEGLTSLDLSSNKISDCSFLNELTSLNSLNLNSNEISDFSFLKELTSLNTLNLGVNKISDCSFLKELTSLNTLDLGWNKISDCSFLKELTSLNTLDLGGNNISDCSFLNELTSLNSLNLNSNEISDFFFLKELTSLNTLNLRGNNISDFSFLKELTSLNILNLGGNKIRDCSFLKELTSLNSLYLGVNKIRDCSFLKELTFLNSLYLGWNNIRDCSFLKELTSLNSLSLNSNEISDFSFLKELTSLNSLDLGWNNIRDCSFLKELTSLNSLSLRSNNIADCSFLAGLNNLAYCNLDKNPIEAPPKSVVDQGLPAIRNYFKQAEDQGFDYIYEAKLLFVGEPGAGKTSLMKKFIDPAYEVPNNTEESTLGIEVHAGWPFKYTKDNTVIFNANLWDFGGQEIQYMIHQFFITPRSFYILVADDRKQQTHYDYWFNIIALLSEAKNDDPTPALVALNEINHKSVTNFDHSVYCERYPELTIGCKDVDLSKSDGRFDVIRNKAQEALSNLKHVGDKLPKQWIPIREEMEKRMDQNHITIAEYFDICKNHKIEKEDDALLISRYLHDLGVILHFQSDSSLADTIFLNPQWTVKAVYAALSDKTLEQNKGKFEKKWLFSLWEKDGYNFDERNKLLTLMLKNNFELCYRIEEGGDYYIAPQLLTSIKPKFSMPAKDKRLRFRMQYPFMPKGIMARLIVRLNRFIACENNEDLVWREGAALADREARAVVVEEENRDGLKVIDMEITGKVVSRMKEFLTVIRAEVKKIHKRSFPNIRFSEMVPCNCKVCLNAEEPHFYKYEFLEERRANGAENVICEKSVSDVMIPGLIDAVFERGEDKSGRDWAGPKGFDLYKQRAPKYDENEKKRTVEPEIFISYAWGGESEKMTDDIYNAFKEKKLNIIRDRIDLQYKGNIREFMRRLGASAFVVVIISDRYLKSKNCMFEMLEIEKNRDAYNRIFPIVLEDAQIYDDIKSIGYALHWQGQLKELKEQIDKLESPHLTEAANKNLAEYASISRLTGNLINMLRDMNTLPVEMHKETWFEQLIESVEARIAQGALRNYSV